MYKKAFPINKYKFDNQDLLSGLTHPECDILNENKVITYFKAGQEIFKEGTTPKGVYRVKKGKGKKVTATNFGTEHIFYICKENEYLGYHAVLSEEDYPDSAIALLDCEVEFYLDQTFDNFTHAKSAAKNATNLYNEIIVHLSLDYKTPNMV